MTDLGYNFLAIHFKFLELYGQRIPEADTIRHWCYAIKGGTFTLERQRKGGRDPLPDVAKEIKKVLSLYPSASIRFISEFLGFSPQTIKHHLIETLKMKRMSLRWIPHTLTDEHKKTRKERATIIYQQLQLHKKFGYRNIITGDETWIYFNNLSN
jgi:hypothetical protein